MFILHSQFMMVLVTLKYNNNQGYLVKDECYGILTKKFPHTSIQALL